MLKKSLLLFSAACASASADSVSVYFGNGCFFHQQHTMVTRFEKLLLKRSGSDVTSVSAYAGGDSSSSDLCYHNEGEVEDYGKLGHAEVVELFIPDDKSLKDAAKVFFEDFTQLAPGQWTRQDVFDLGPEYRALVGIPGGVSGPYYSAIVEANSEVHNLNLKEGQGGDDDTIDTGVVWVMDSLKFPAYQAEVCLQFSDDNPAFSEPYSEKYHSLRDALFEEGTLRNTTCPTNYIC
ncbi:hypothetical protein TrVE_jg2731 [Triparma verrucosa]|uniref:Peptide-methionine (S)-S-oxide reductase n=1 Tax=Triparma verrucosa TaxID=1606542 RepID=A0A9W7KY01_9STRA|nr:hypothetical protein TrVE_jg2731 [Triparma verrucosa]